LGSVQRFQVREAPRPRGEAVKISTLVGVSAGALVGLVAGFATTKRERVSCPINWNPFLEDDCQRRPRLSYAREGAIGGALLGGVGGLLVGTFARLYTWRPVYVRSLAVQVAPSSRGLGVGLTLRL
jgi:hypothetical protein